MSNRAHSGRCFRSKRSTAARKESQGKTYVAHPTRWKVPLLIRPFLRQDGGRNALKRTTYDEMGLAIARYTQHRALTGTGPAVRAAD